MSDCTYQPRLSAYYDGELSEAHRAEIDRHLAGCPACSAELQSYSRLSQVMAAQHSVHVPGEMLSRLRENVRHGARQQAWREAGMQFDRTVRRVTAVAAVIIVGASAALILLPGKEAGENASEVIVESLAVGSDTAPAELTTSTPGGEERKMARWIAADLSQRSVASAALRSHP